jgi:hypothetical protein
MKGNIGRQGDAADLEPSLVTVIDDDPEMRAVLRVPSAAKACASRRRPAASR